MRRRKHLRPPSAREPTRRLATPSPGPRRYPLTGPAYPFASLDIIDGFPDGLILLDASGACVATNSRARTLLQALGLLQGSDSCPDKGALAAWPALLRVCEQDEPVSADAAGHTPEGERVFELRAAPALDPGGCMCRRLVLIRDVTDERRCAERRLVEQVALAVLQERARLGREFHDGLAQDLAVLRMKLGAWEFEQDSQQAAELAAARSLLRSDMDDLRRTILALRPLVLDETGFLGALRTFVTDLASLTALRVDIHVQGSADPLPLAMENVLFRVLQEAVFNVAKHANARTVSISLDYNLPASIVAHVRDDGCGFDPDTLLNWRKNGHLGLTLMGERIEALGGTLAVSSERDRGTAICITLPK